MEMFVVVAIITIMATLVIPAFGQLLNRERLISVTNNLTATLQASRSEAIKRSSDIKVQATGQYWEAIDSATNSVLLRSSAIDSQLSVGQLPDLTISATGSVTVTPPETMPVTFTLANLNNQTCSEIQILSSGQVTTEIGSCP